MKTKTALTIFLVAILQAGCIAPRYITEKYIKNNIEQHEEGKYSSIKLYSILQTTAADRSFYIEFTGYKYNGKKGLVIGVDRYYLARKNYKDDNTVIAKIEYIDLTIEQCQSIIDNRKILRDKVIKESPLSHEDIYQDFTVSMDLFMSYHVSSLERSALYLSLWIKGDKYNISARTLVSKLEDFITY